MFKYYLQLLSVLVTFFGTVACCCWVVLTLMYYDHVVESGKDVSLNTMKLSLVICAIALNITGFYYSLKWVKRSKSYRDEKMKKYREVTRF